MPGLTDAQQRDLRRCGYVRVPAIVDRGTAQAMEDRVWEWLAGRDGVDRIDRSTWPAVVKKLQPLRKAGVFDEFVNATTAAIAEQLLGPGWHAFAQRPQALLSFPTDASWEIPHTTWHFDLPARGSTSRMEAMRCLGFVSDVAPRGGGTLIVEGSHALVRAMVERAPHHDFGQSSDVRNDLNRRSAWFAALSTAGGDRVEQFMTDGDVIDGVPVRVVELTGTPGDMVIMHPWMLHNISMNVADRPRIMTSFTLFAAGYQPYAPTIDN